MQDPLVFEAMQYALQVHADQKRKYTGNPYFTHLAEVAGITASVIDLPEAIAGAWLHDTIEDCDATYLELYVRFGPKVADIVLALSGLETEGNRAVRKAAAKISLLQRRFFTAPTVTNFSMAFSAILKGGRPTFSYYFWSPFSSRQCSTYCVIFSDRLV